MNSSETNAMLTLLCAGLCLLGPAAAQDTSAPALEDYAWGFPILVDRDASFYKVELPLLVNQSVSDVQLRDAGVYNGDGLPVPRIFQRTSDAVEQSEHVVALSAIRLLEDSEASTEDVRLRFERQGDRTIVEFDADGAPPGEQPARLAAYIVDTRNVKPDIDALEFTWPASESGGFIGRIMIDGSNNLQDWREVGAGAVADLREAQTTILQREVRVRSTSHDFLRIRWEGMPDGWHLTGIRGQYTDGETTVVRKSQILDVADRDKDDGGYVYDLAGTPTVDRIRVMLSQPNTVVAASIFYWSDERREWTKVASGSFYHLGRGNNIVLSPVTHVRAARIRRLKFVVNQGQTGTPPQLEIGWRPDTLIFLAQGQPPYTLAAGRSADRTENFPLQRMFGNASIISLANKDRAAQADLGPRFALGGATNLAPDTAPDWRRLSLWFGLFLGVAFVAAMAFKVLRDLKSN